MLNVNISPEIYQGKIFLRPGVFSRIWYAGLKSSFTEKTQTLPVQNKIDLIKEEQAKQQHQEILR